MVSTSYRDDPPLSESYPPPNSPESTPFLSYDARPSHRRTRPCARCSIILLLLGMMALMGSQLASESKRAAIKDLVNDRLAQGLGYWDWDAVRNETQALHSALLPVEEEEQTMDSPAPEAQSEEAESSKGGGDRTEEEQGLGTVEEEGSQEGVEEEVTSLEEEKSEPLRIKALPKGRIAQDTSPESTIKYLGYLPHSGFHNQRMELENALLLAKLLGRTLLLPPIWLGQPVARQMYDDLQVSWTNMYSTHSSSFGLPPSSVAPDSPLFDPPTSLYTYSSTLYPHPQHSTIKATHHDNLATIALKNREKWLNMGYELTSEGYPITNLTSKECKSRSWECRSVFKDSFIGWEWLVDLDKEGTSELVKMVDRWDLRERSLEDLLGVKPEDYYIMRDEQTYDFKFVKGGSADGPLMVNDRTGSHWGRRVSLEAFKAIPQRVVLIGSLFGSGRIFAATEETDLWRKTFQRSMVFRNPHLVDPANAIRSRLGGVGSYVAVHARVGDGIFRAQAKKKMEESFKSLVGRMKVGDETEEEIWKYVNDRKIWGRNFGRRNDELVLGKRDWSWLDAEEGGVPGEDEDAIFATIVKRAPIPPTPLQQLKCRLPLHTSANLLPFNTPLYIATDSRSPTTDKNLLPFFRAFPCTFVLDDFDEPSDINDQTPLREVQEMMRLVNDLDNEKIGIMLLPFLEAVVVAKARTAVGTSQSTFSGFATGFQHRVYAEEDFGGSGEQ